jgi:hypothetical protein
MPVELHRDIQLASHNHPGRDDEIAFKATANAPESLQQDVEIDDNSKDPPAPQSRLRQRASRVSLTDRSLPAALDPVLARQVLRKIDLWMMPIMSLVYMLQCACTRSAL